MQRHFVQIHKCLLLERYNFSIFYKFEDYKYDVIDLIIKLLSREKTYLPPEIRSLICDYLLYYTDDEFNIWKVNNNILPLKYNENKIKDYTFNGYSIILC